MDTNNLNQLSIEEKRALLAQFMQKNLRKKQLPIFHQKIINSIVFQNISK